MKHYIVVESRSEEELLFSALPPDIMENIKIVVAGSRGSMLPLTNSIAVAKQAPVALIMSADTLNDDRIREEELDFEDFASLLPVKTPPVLFLGIPDVATSLTDAFWMDRLLDFARQDDYALANPFEFRR